jgi:hypothetical protein
MRHAEHFFEVPGIAGVEHFSPTASGTFHGQDAPDIIWTVGSAHPAKLLFWSSVSVTLVTENVISA